MSSVPCKREGDVEIYLVTFPNGKQYVGQALIRKGLGATRRWKQHLRDAARGYCFAFHHALNKYGADKCTWDVLVTVARSEADEYEDMFIDLYDTLSPKGYNLVKGNGNGSRICSEETRAKISAGLRGHVISEETRAKIAASQRGKVIPKETREKLALANRGRVFSQESLAKRAASRKANNNNEHLPMFIHRYQRKNTHGFKVAYKGVQKYFAVPKHLPKDDALQKACAFLKRISTCKDAYDAERTRFTPSNVYPYKRATVHGFKVVYKGHYKLFVVPISEPLDAVHQQAHDYVLTLRHM